MQQWDHLWPIGLRGRAVERFYHCYWSLAHVFTCAESVDKPEGSQTV